MIAAIQPLQHGFLSPLSLGGNGSPGVVDDDAPIDGPAASATPLRDTSADAPLGFGSLVDALNAGGTQLDRAESAENAFAKGTGGLQEMVFERAKADSLVSVAAAAGSRVAQSINTLSQMQL